MKKDRYYRKVYIPPISTRLMKIKINDLETYELSVPEEISAKDLFILIDKLDKIGKLIRTTSNFEEKETDDRGKKTYHLTREQKIEVMKVFYLGTKKERDQISRKYGINFKTFSGHNYWRKQEHIEPSELGLIRFPRRGESRGEALTKLKIGNELIGKSFKNEGEAIIAKERLKLRPNNTKKAIITLKDLKDGKNTKIA